MIGKNEKRLRQRVRLPADGRALRKLESRGVRPIPGSALFHLKPYFWQFMIRRCSARAPRASYNQKPFSMFDPFVIPVEQMIVEKYFNRMKRRLTQDEWLLSV